METRTKRLIAAVEDYFTGLRRMRASGGATGERSSYGLPLAAYQGLDTLADSAFQIRREDEPSRVLRSDIAHYMLQ